MTRRQLVLRLAALAFVPALLLAAELGLRATETEQPQLVLPTGWDGDVRVVTAGNREHPLEAYTGPDGQARVRTSQAMLDSRFMHPVDYAVQRPAGVFRVFCFGGSATLGVPVEATPELTFPGQLAELLEGAGLQAEVINLGGASFGSDRVVELMAQVVRHQPSALVVYSGNNEFFEYALALHEGNREAAGAVFQRRSGLRLVRVLWSMSDRVHDSQAELSTPEDLERRQQALVRTAVELQLSREPEARPTWITDDLLQRRDAPYNAVVQRYRANLARMVELARGVAPLVLVSVPANLHQEPFQALNDPSLSERELSRWSDLLVRGQAELEAGRLDQAVAALDQAIAIDPLNARAHYLRGRALLASGDLRGATLALHNGLELDMAPGRPVAALSELVYHFVDPPAVLVVDPTSSFEIQGIASGGTGYFHDACHLTPEGYAALARHISRAMLGAGIAANPPAPQADPG